MKFVFVLMMVPLLSFAASPSEPYVYNFPGCNPGSGTWPAAILQIPQDACAIPDGENIQTYGGHCNGRLALKLVCENSKIKSVDVQDCYCD